MMKLFLISDVDHLPLLYANTVSHSTITLLSIQKLTFFPNSFEIKNLEFYYLESASYLKYEHIFGCYAPSISNNKQLGKLRELSVFFINRF